MEFVFVVPRAELFREFYPQGFLPFGEGFSFESLQRAIRSHGFFVERSYAERSPTLKQLIPYSVVLCKDQDGGILLMRRLDASGEQRLHDKLSIGVGGHINPEDIDDRNGGDVLHSGTQREVSEELVLDGSYEARPIGLLNDDSNAVGAVHVGVVQILAVDGSVRIRERDMLEGRVVRPEELSELLGQGANFETWSSILIEHLDEILPQSPTDTRTSRSLQMS